MEQIPEIVTSSWKLQPGGICLSLHVDGGAEADPFWALVALVVEDNSIETLKEAWSILEKIYGKSFDLRYRLMQEFWV